MKPKDKGNFGEYLATVYLKNKGYQIIERNFHSKFGEIDIIAKYRENIIFIEVRMRNKSDYYPEETIDRKKIKKIIKTAQVFLYKNGLNKAGVRFDVISIKDGNINHIENAFDIDF